MLAAMPQPPSPERRRELPIAIVGAGRLGSALALALGREGYRVVAIAGRDARRARALAARIEGAAAVAPRASLDSAELVFLTVPDDAVGSVAGALSWRAGQAAVHCSGALGLDVLEAAARQGAAVGCLHPIQSFPDPDGDPDRFHGIAAGIEAAEPLGETLEAMASELGARPVRLEGVDRGLYHAAGVLASNDVIALAAAAIRAWRLAGLSECDARRAAGPLLAGAANAVAELPEDRPLREALTGPVARGDLATVERHLAALAAEPRLRELYRRLGSELLALDLGHDAATARRLRELLGDEPA
jgi:predicted short-subunit dehydrogenase-like oxidoreductase (DUF2520 family)